MFYDWKEEYLVKIDSIDEQHQKLFMMVKVLHDYMEAGQSHLIMKNFLHELIVYTEKHFSDEEEYMTQIEVPTGYFEAHVKEHGELITQVKEFKAEFDAKKEVFTIKMIRFLVDWLRNHIVNTDHQIADYLNKKGER